MNFGTNHLPCMIIGGALTVNEAQDWNQEIHFHKPQITTACLAQTIILTLVDQNLDSSSPHKLIKAGTKKIHPIVPTVSDQNLHRSLSTQSQDKKDFPPP